jgi:hypothetical protein
MEAVGSSEYTVYVRSYLRCRFGVWETIVTHFRRPRRRKQR